MKNLAMWTGVFVMLICGSVYGFPMFDDFESGLDPGWTGGAISTDQAVSGDHSLMLVADEIALFDFSPLGSGNAGVLSLWVYDRGATAEEGSNAYGPRWGIYSEDVGTVGGASDAQSVAGGTIIWRSFLNGNNGYGNSVGENPLTAGSWFSPNFQGGPRVQGWMKWTITLDQNFDVTIESELSDGTPHSTFTSAGEAMFDRAIGPNPPSGARGVYLFGGRSCCGDVAGVYVDDVQWVPEPASLGILAFGGLMLLRRR